MNISLIKGIVFVCLFPTLANATSLPAPYRPGNFEIECSIARSQQDRKDGFRSARIEKISMNQSNLDSWQALNITTNAKNFIVESYSGIMPTKLDGHQARISFSAETTNAPEQMRVSLDLNDSGIEASAWGHGDFVVGKKMSLTAGKSDAELNYITLECTRIR